MNVPKISSKTSLFLFTVSHQYLNDHTLFGANQLPHQRGTPGSYRGSQYVTKRQLDTTYKQWRRYRLQTTFFSLVYRSVVPSCRRGNRVHFAPSFGIGGNHYGNRVFSLFCQT